MDMFILLFFILMAAILVVYSKEVYMYLVFTLGSLMVDIQDKLKSITGRKK